MTSGVRNSQKTFYDRIQQDLTTEDDEFGGKRETKIESGLQEIFKTKKQKTQNKNLKPRESKVGLMTRCDV